jgi:hypothetical protein
LGVGKTTHRKAGSTGGRNTYSLTLPTLQKEAASRMDEMITLTKMHEKAKIER